MGSELLVGALAPDFSLPSTKRRQIGPVEFRGKKNVLLVFYVKDGTSG